MTRAARGRVLSGAIVLAYVAVGRAALGEWRYSAGFAIRSILPLACIWFAPAMAGAQPPFLAGPTRPSPPGLLRTLGWILLLAPGAAAAYLAWRG